MHNTNQTLEKIIDELEKALAAAEGIGEPTLAFLLERALDEARSKQFPAPRPNDASLQ
jgi:hypothetical protein